MSSAQPANDGQGYLLELTREIQREEVRVCLWKGSDDGYRWESYGSRKLMDGSRNRKSYYRCQCVRAPNNCQAKKIVTDHPADGRVSIVTYKNQHNHERKTTPTLLNPILRAVDEPEILHDYSDGTPSVQDRTRISQQWKSSQIARIPPPRRASSSSRVSPATQEPPTLGGYGYGGRKSLKDVLAAARAADFNSVSRSNSAPLGNFISKAKAQGSAFRVSDVPTTSASHPTSTASSAPTNGSTSVRPQQILTSTSDPEARSKALNSLILNQSSMNDSLNLGPPPNLLKSKSLPSTTLSSGARSPQPLTPMTIPTLNSSTTSPAHAPPLLSSKSPSNDGLMLPPVAQWSSGQGFKSLSAPSMDYFLQAVKKSQRQSLTRSSLPANLTIPPILSSSTSASSSCSHVSSSIPGDVPVPCPSMGLDMLIAASQSNPVKSSPTSSFAKDEHVEGEEGMDALPPFLRHSAFTGKRKREEEEEEEEVGDLLR